MLKLQAKVPKIFTSQRWLSALFSTCFGFGGLKSILPCVNNLFRGIPFSHEDKIHEHTQESFLLRRRTKGNFACCFCSFLQVFKRGFLQKISSFNGKEWPIKAGKLRNLSWHIGDKQDCFFNIIALILRYQEFFKRRVFLLTRPLLGQIMGIEAGFKSFSPCPYLPDYILFAKRALKLLIWWNWTPCIVCSEIVCNFKKHRKASTPPAKTCLATPILVLRTTSL